MYSEAVISRRGMNLSSLLSIVNDFIILIFFKNRRISIGMLTVTKNIIARHTSTLMKEVLTIPEVISMTNIQKGRNIGCEIAETNVANLFMI